MASPASAYRIERLLPTHDRESFTCGVEALNRYIRQQAGQDAKRNTAAVSILTPDSRTVAGFYTLSALSVPFTDVPLTLQKKLPRTPIPVTLLGRMAVAEGLRGQGLGVHLLMDALHTAYTASQTIASWAVVVDAKDGARDFYIARGFEPLLDRENHLSLPMATIGRTIPSQR